MTDLEVEEEEFNDLAVFDFTDSYRNLTIKRLVSFHFALKVFNTSFFFNVDDDMYVNFRAVFHLLSGYREGQGVMAGYCPTGVSVTRNRRSKWFVSEDNFPEPAFPQFCFGFAYIISRSAMEGVVGSNERGVNLPPLDDVAVGILAAKHGNITLQHHKWWWIKYGYRENYCPDSFTMHGLKPQQIYSMWSYCRDKQLIAKPFHVMHP